jgi:hypothetical protein
MICTLKYGVAQSPQQRSQWREKLAPEAARRGKPKRQRSGDIAATPALCMMKNKKDRPPIRGRLSDMEGNDGLAQDLGIAGRRVKHANSTMAEHRMSKRCAMGAILARPQRRSG